MNDQTRRPEFETAAAAVRAEEALRVLNDAWAYWSPEGNVAPSVDEEDYPIAA